MNIASLGLSRELYELSGWVTDNTLTVNVGSELDGTYMQYDLGYLLEKLPEGSWVRKSIRGFDSGLIHVPSDTEGRSSIMLTDDTPEDAACRLALALFKEGILSKEAA